MRLSWFGITSSLIVVSLLSGCGRSVHTDFAHPVPATVNWNGTSYTTKGGITTVGQKLGEANTSAGKLNIYAVPGQSSSHEIAVEVDTPSVKYVEADATTQK